MEKNEERVATEPLAMVPARAAAVTPVQTIEQAKERYEAMVAYVKTLLRKDIDYGVIPGTAKPTLLKPGAEKLTTFFGLVPDPTLVDRHEDWEKGIFSYTYRVELKTFDGRLIAACEGEANSLEDKYRWRNIPSWEATDEQKRIGEKTERYSKKRKRNYVFYKVPNPEPWTLPNTLRKMAQKRALIGATLLAANASEFFTQDIEDMGAVIHSQATEIPKEETPPTPKAEAEAVAEAFPQAEVKEVSLKQEEKWSRGIKKLAKEKGYSEDAIEEVLKLWAASPRSEERYQTACEYIEKHAPKEE